MINRKSLIMSTTAFASLITASAGFAQTAAAAPQAATEENYGDIVVTAQRREQRLSEVPISVTAQTGEQLTRAGITDSRALERISPALSFSGSFSTSSTSYSMRGVQSLVDEAAVQPSVGVVIDNVPVARQAEVVLDLADIDRVEVLSGPQGTLFGKNATAGVINIVSNRPKFEFGGSGEASYTTDEQFIAKGMLNLPLGDKVAARVNGFYNHQKPLIDNISPLGEDQFGGESYGVAGKLLFNVSDTTNILLSSSYRHFEGGVAPGMIIVPNSGPLGVLQTQVLNGAVGRGKDFVNQDTPTQNKGSNYSFTGEINSELSDSLKLVAITGYRHFEILSGPDTDLGPTGVLKGRGISPNPLGYPIQFVSMDTPQKFVYKYWSQEVRLAYSAPGLDVVVGGYYQNYDETQFKETTTFLLDSSFVGLPFAGVPFYVGNFINEKIGDNTGAVFADATIEIVPTVKVFGGLRYTKEKLSLDYSRTNFFLPVGGPGGFDPVTYTRGAPSGVTAFSASRKDKNLSGRLGVQWQPQRNLNYYASFNRGYKGPAASGGQAMTGAGDALFKPEIATSFELGAKQRFLDGALAIDIALYKQKIKNIQITAVPPGTVFAALTNAGALKTDGIEFNVTAHPTREFTLTGGIVYNDAKYSGPFSYICGPSATPGVGSCAANGFLSLDGTRAVGVPKLKVVSTANYAYELSDNLKLVADVDASFRSSVQYQLQHDPQTRQPGYAIFNASLALAQSDDKWQVTAFVKNITNKYAYAFIYTADSFIGQSWGYLPRDFKRYGGVRVNFNF